jgi:predicted ferric reductase
MIRRPAALALVIAYLVLALLPLGVALAPPRPAGRSFALELALALGFVGLGQMALQFALIARFRRVSQPFGIDLVMQYHRQIGVLSILFVFAHPVVLLAESRAYWTLLRPSVGGAAIWTGVVATLALLAIAVASYWRKSLGIGYESWRVTHALAGVAALALAQAHVSLAGTYVDAPWKHAALVAWCALFVGFVVHLRLLKPFAFRRHPWEVVEVRPDVARTWNLVLAPVGHAGLRFAPGQFAWLKIGVSPWSVRENPFSFSSSAEHPERLEFGIKELGDSTNAIGRLRLGTRVYVDGPHGSFSSDFHPTEGFVMIAGGVGISPILSMLRTLADRGDRRPVSLVYACSRWDRVAFRAELEALGERLALDLVYVLEGGHPGWTGPTGYVTREVLAPLVAPDPEARQVFLCGPDAMMEAVERILVDCGVPEERIELERFDLV